MIPEDFQRGMVYTVDPRVLAPLVSGEQYRIVASTRFLVPKDEAFTGYELLYRRARRLVDRRRAELTCAGLEGRIHAWLLSHGWFRMEISQGALVGAVVTLGAACISPTADGPQGEPDPTAEALQSPFVAQLGAAGVTSYDEFYNDFDMRKDRARSSVLTVSYGEYVPFRDGVDFDSIIARAESRARMYLDVVKDETEQLALAQRTWNCIDTGKAAKPFLAHVDLQFATDHQD